MLGITSHNRAKIVYILRESVDRTSCKANVTHLWHKPIICSRHPRNVNQLPLGLLEYSATPHLETNRLASHLHKARLKQACLLHRITEEEMWKFSSLEIKRTIILLVHQLLGGE